MPPSAATCASAAADASSRGLAAMPRRSGRSCSSTGRAVRASRTLADALVARLARRRRRRSCASTTSTRAGTDSSVPASSSRGRSCRPRRARRDRRLATVGLGRGSRRARSSGCRPGPAAHHRGMRRLRRGARGLDAVRVWVEAPMRVRKRRALDARRRRLRPVLGRVGAPVARYVRRTAPERHADVRRRVGPRPRRTRSEPDAASRRAAPCRRRARGLTVVP